MSHNASPGIAAGGGSPEHFARGGIAQVGPVGLMFQYHEELLTRARGDEVAQVQGIAMFEAGAVEGGAIGVQCPGAIMNLLSAVAGHVAHANPVCTFAINRRIHLFHRAVGIGNGAGIACRAAVQPAQGEVGTVPVVGTDATTAVVAACKDG